MRGSPVVPQGLEENPSATHKDQDEKDKNPRLHSVFRMHGIHTSVFTNVFNSDSEG